jgi:DDE superfamily endonuclease
MKREEALQRQTWLRYRSWSRITSGVLLSVLGAVQYGTSKVFYKVVPHFDAQELRQYLHQVMATFSKTGKEVVMVVDRSGIHRAHKLDATLEHYHSKFRFHFLPAHCGHHLNPIEGFAQFLAVCSRSKVVAMSPESIAETAVFAGDEPCWGEAICYATARFNALQSTIN